MQIIYNLTIGVAYMYSFAKIRAQFKQIYIDHLKYKPAKV